MSDPVDNDYEALALSAIAEANTCLVEDTKVFDLTERYLMANTALARAQVYAMLATGDQVTILLDKLERALADVRAALSRK